ncbi:testis-expressed protein 10-like [Liolophura sinensis]|uniref:testis-expressed protein 10-like n=1 Tax=Liolophura sinensis TaxID=3198878 RepID=UPI0031590C67
MPKGKKKKNKDFQKVKLKVGKRLPKADNETRTSFKARTIQVPEQLRGRTEGGEPTTHRKLSLTELLSQLQHYNVSVRCSAVTGLRELIGRDSALLYSHLPMIVGRTSELFTDKDPVVRQAVIRLMRVVLPQLSANQIGPFFPMVSAHLCCAMTHIYEEIRMDSLFVMDVFLDSFPGLVTNNSTQILLNFVEQISTRIAASGRSQAEQSLSVNPTSRLSTLKWRVKVLERLQKFLTALTQNSSREHTSSCTNQSDSSNPEENVISFHQMAAHAQEFAPVCKRMWTSYSYILGAKSLVNTDNKPRLDRSDVSCEMFVKSLLPLLLECWVEATAIDKKKSSSVDGLVSPDSLVVMVNVVNVIKLLWRYVRSISSEEGNSDWVPSEYRKDFIKHVMSYFPYSVHEAPRRKDKKLIPSDKSVNGSRLRLEKACLSSSERLKAVSGESLLVVHRTAPDCIWRKPACRPQNGSRPRLGKACLSSAEWLQAASGESLLIVHRTAPGCIWRKPACHLQNSSRLRLDKACLSSAERVQTASGESLLVVYRTVPDCVWRKPGCLLQNGSRLRLEKACLSSAERLQTVSGESLYVIHGTAPDCNDSKLRLEKACLSSAEWLQAASGESQIVVRRTAPDCVWGKPACRLQNGSRLRLEKACLLSTERHQTASGESLLVFCRTAPGCVWRKPACRSQNGSRLRLEKACLSSAGQLQTVSGERLLTSGLSLNLSVCDIMCYFLSDLTNEKEAHKHLFSPVTKYVLSALQAERLSQEDLRCLISVIRQILRSNIGKGTVEQMLEACYQLYTQAHTLSYVKRILLDFFSDLSQRPWWSGVTCHSHIFRDFHQELPALLKEVASTHSQMAALVLAVMKAGLIQNKLSLSSAHLEDILAANEGIFVSLSCSNQRLIVDMMFYVHTLDKDHFRNIAKIIKSSSITEELSCYFVEVLFNRFVSCDTKPSGKTFCTLDTFLSFLMTVALGKCAHWTHFSVSS